VTVETSVPAAADLRARNDMATSKMSPSADRTIRILNYLAGHPDQSFTFSAPSEPGHE
jgi:hypothetical protein